MNLTDYQKELLKIFQEALQYGYSKMSTIPLDYTKTRQKKHLLYLIMGATQSYSESILKLITPPNVYDKAAEVLFRSLIETQINLDYIFAGKSQRNAKVFLLHSLIDDIDFADKYKKFISKYPSWKFDFGGMKTVKDWQTFIDKKEKDVLKIKKKNNIPINMVIPDLRSRAIQADNYLRSLNRLKQDSSLEFQYVNYYKFFSQISHLTMPGLERFFHKNPDGSRKLVIDGSQDDFERIGTVTFAIYCSILRFFLIHYGTYNHLEFKKYKTFIKSISKNKKVATLQVD